MMVRVRAEGGGVPLTSRFVSSGGGGRTAA